MKFLFIFVTALTTLLTLTSAISIAEDVKFDLQAISAKFADIDKQLNKFGVLESYLNDFKDVQRETTFTAEVITTKALALKKRSGKMSREEYRTTLVLFKTLRESIFKTTKLFIAKKPTVLKVDVNAYQNIHPVPQTKDMLKALFHAMSEYERVMGGLLPHDLDFGKAFETMRAEIAFAFILAINAYRRE